MAVWTIACESCRRLWQRVGAYSIYQRQAVESCPCPACGAYTLTCRPPKGPKERKRKQLVA